MHTYKFNNNNFGFCTKLLFFSLLYKTSFFKQEPFIAKPRPPKTVLDLIERTKNQVRALDKANYNRITKIIMNDEMDGDVPSTPASPSVAIPSGRNGSVMETAEEVRINLILHKAE